jgi:hypothetical protein
MTAMLFSNSCVRARLAETAVAVVASGTRGQQQQYSSAAAGVPAWPAALLSNRYGIGTAGGSSSNNGGAVGQWRGYRQGVPFLDEVVWQPCQHL